VPLLQEVQLVEAGEEDRVEVDVEQVVEILAVAAGEGVGGPVGGGEGVHEGVERTARHHEERVAHRVFAAAAQTGVFEDVRHPGGVLRDGAERHQKGVLIILSV